MVRSLRRWVQIASAVLATAAVATAVVLCALHRHPEAPSATAVDETLQLQLQPATGPALVTVPPPTYPMNTPPTLMPTVAMPSMPPTVTMPGSIAAPSSTTNEAVSDMDDHGGVPAVLAAGGMYLFQLGIVFLCLGIQVCCYMRSTHEPADIEVGLEADPQTVGQDLWGPRLLLTQVIKLIELCGCEARNRYVSGDGNFYIDERSDCPQRCCASVNRELTLFGHAGPSEEAPVVLRMFKPYHLQGCCFCRPEMRIDVPMGDQKMVNVGKIEDPCKCCVVNQLVFDSNEQQRYEVTGPVCQCGACCPCCADFNFDINDQSGATVGTITKKKLSLKECCTKTNRFEVDFPKQCTMDDKRLLVGSAMLLDLQYFEQNKNNN